MTILADKKLNKILNNNKKNWQKFYSQSKVFSVFPNIQIVRLISPIKNKIKKILDIGSGEKAQTKWLKNKKIISLDYCKIKGSRIFNLDLRYDSLNLDKLIKNSELILMTQILDHITFQNALSISEDINLYYDHTKFIILSFMKKDSWGSKIKGDIKYNGLYLSKIAHKSSINELHFFYNDNQVSKVIKKFSNFKIINKIVESYLYENKKNKNSSFYMNTEYYLLKRI